MTVKAKIKDSSGEWEESFEVESMNTAEVEIKKVIDNFNNTLRSGETPRTVVKIIGEDTRKQEEDKKPMFTTVEHIVVGKTVFGNYRALKIRGDADIGGVVFWVNAEKIKNKKDLLPLTCGEFNALTFKCKNPTATAMCFDTEFVYIQNACHRCPLLFRYANSQSYSCRLRMHSDKKMIYDEQGQKAQ